MTPPPKPTTLRRAATEVKKLSSAEIYKKQQKVATKFLDPDKSIYLSGKALRLLSIFVNDYMANRSSTLDITGLSSRDRIYLLNSIINLKVKPLLGAINKIAFKALRPNAALWEVTGAALPFVDLKPTTFQIGDDFTRVLTLNPSFDQRGNGVVTPEGITWGTSYETINKLFIAHPGKLGTYFSWLLKQRTDGLPIIQGTEEENILLNELNLLLDYEVARRPFEKDTFKDLPVVTYLSLMIKHLENFEALVVGKDTGREEISYGKKKKVRESSLVATGLDDNGDRKGAAEKIIKTLFKDIQRSNEIRCGMRLNGPDEDSDDNYSGDDRGAEIPTLPIEIYNEFLSTISARYINAIRNDNSQRGEVLWGGDIELIEIANQYNLTITVYQYARDANGEIQKDVSGNSMIEQEPSYPVIGPQNGIPINLFFGGGHYENLIVRDGRGRMQPTNDIPPDGNCMFRAILRAMTAAGVQDIPGRIFGLREIVADRLNALVDRINQEAQEEETEEQRSSYLNENDPIRTRFATIFQARNRAQRHEAMLLLPPSSLRDEALSLRRGLLESTINTQAAIGANSGSMSAAVVSAVVNNPVGRALAAGLASLSLNKISSLKPPGG